jgi:Flp pilus assembly pilin Flp
MSKQLISLWNFLLLVWQGEQGQGLTEYVLLVFLLAIALIVSVGAVGFALQGTYGTIIAAIP